MSYLQQQNRSSILHVASDRDTPNNFAVNLPQNVPELRRVCGVQILNVTMPNLFYNIDFSNNLLTVNLRDGTFLYYTIPDGHYSLASLIKLFTPVANGGVNLLDSTSTVNLSHHVALDQDEFSSKVVLTMLHGHGLEGSLLHVLGFDAPIASQAQGGPYVSFQADRLPELDLPQLVYIHSPQLTDGFIDVTPHSSTMKDIFAVVPLSADFGDLQSWAPPTPYIKEFTKSHRCLNTIHISLRRPDGSLMPFYGRHWSMILRVFYSLDF